MHVRVDWKGHSFEEVAYVANCQSLLGLPWIEKAGSINEKLEEALCGQVKAVMPNSNAVGTLLQEKYPEVYKPELGLCTKERVHTEVKEGASPKFIIKRREELIAVREAIEVELARRADVGNHPYSACETGSARTCSKQTKWIATCLL